MLLADAGKAKSIVPSGAQSMPKATIIRPAGSTKKLPIDRELFVYLFSCVSCVSYVFLARLSL